MKSSRHNAILEIIENNNVETQRSCKAPMELRT